MRRTTTLLLALLIMILILCGCNTTTQNTKDVTESLNETSPSSLYIGSESISDVLKIYEESMKSNISTYCEEYLTYTGTPIDKLESIKDIITDDHYKKIKSTESYYKSDDEYEQATALNTLYFEDYSTPSTRVKVLAQCYQSVVVKNKSTTYNTFYIFNMKYDEDNGWIIDSVEKPANEYLED